MAETPQALVARFFQTVPIAHLRTADLDVRMINALWAGWHDRNVALAKVLAESPGLAGLKRLWLRHIGVGDEGGLALARSPHLAGLEILDLSENALSPEVEAALRERFGQRLCLGRPDFSHFTLGELGWA